MDETGDVSETGDVLRESGRRRAAYYLIHSKESLIARGLGRAGRTRPGRDRPIEPFGGGWAG